MSRSRCKTNFPYLSQSFDGKSNRFSFVSWRSLSKRYCHTVLDDVAQNVIESQNIIALSRQYLPPRTPAQWEKILHNMNLLQVSSSCRSTSLELRAANRAAMHGTLFVMNDRQTLKTCQTMPMRALKARCTLRRFAISVYSKQIHLQDSLLALRLVAGAMGCVSWLTIDLNPHLFLTDVLSGLSVYVERVLPMHPCLILCVVTVKSLLHLMMRAVAAPNFTGQH
jgi:hypothetical protein